MVVRLKQPHITVFLGLALTLVTVVCYWPMLHHGFLSIDDQEYIYDNSHVKGGLSWAGMLWAFTTAHASNWHPLTWLSHMLDCQLYGLNPAGHHLTNLVLHALNSLLLFLLLRRMTGTLWRSALVAAFFAWHPLHVESVAWASERKDVLSCLFFLLTLWAYGRYVETKGQSPGAAPCRPPSTEGASPIPHQTFFWYALALLFFALGLMSKPMLVTLPFVLLLLDFWPLQRFELKTQNLTLRALKPLALEKTPFLLLSLVSSVVTFVVQRSGGAVASWETLALPTRLANALTAYIRYLSNTLWPSDLAAIYPYVRHLQLAWVLGAALLLMMLSFAFCLAAKQHPSLAVGWFWFLGTLVPAIGLVQVGPQSIADRYMYIPGIGLFILVVWGVEALLRFQPHQSALAAGLGSVAVAGCLVGTAMQLPYWQNSEKLFRRAIRVTRDNYIAYDGLGSALDVLGRDQEAKALFAAAVQLQPAYLEAQYDLGTVLLKEGDLPGAELHFAAALASNPAFVPAHINLGKALLSEGRLDEAALHLARAVTLAPEDPETHYNFGTVLLVKGNLAEAAASFAKALRLKPDYEQAHSNLAVALMRQGNWREGAAHFAEAMRLNPLSPEAHFNAGLALLQLERPAEAAKRFSEALQIEPDAPNVHYHLALALSRENNPQQALLHAQKARTLALARGQDETAAKAAELLKQFGAL